MLNAHVHQNEVSMATDTHGLPSKGCAALRSAGTNRTSADAGSGGHCHRAALIEARHNPETAHSLFTLASYG